MDEDKVLAAIGELRTAVMARLEQVEARLEQVEARLERAEAADARLRGDVMARFERVEDRLTSMAEDIKVTMMAVQVEDKRRVSDRSELLAMSELLTAMQRQTMRLRTDVDQLNAARPPAE